MNCEVGAGFLDEAEAVYVEGLLVVAGLQQKGNREEEEQVIDKKQLLNAPRDPKNYLVELLDSHSRHLLSKSQRVNDLMK